MPVIWRFTDGKPGHERQTAGLIRALKNFLELNVVEVAVHDLGLNTLASLWHWATHRFPAFGAEPNIIIGAGRACRLPMLAARATHGGTAVCLMHPKLLTPWFDLCVIPQHDEPRLGPNVIETIGVLNDVEASSDKDPNLALILIGGPSSHFGWNETELMSQVEALVAENKTQRLLLSCSRRTPTTTAQKLERLSGIDFIDHRKTATDWLPQTVAKADLVWVSEDSISMIFEAMTAGARVGLLSVPKKRSSRITKVPQSLIDKRYVTPFSNWSIDNQLTATPVLKEAERVAEILVEHLARFGGAQ